MKKTKFRPHAIYPDDREFDKNYSQNQHIANLLDEVDFFKELNKTQIDGIKQMISSIEVAIKERLKVTPNITYDELEQDVYNFINNFLFLTSSPTKNDLYLFKTIELVLKNPDIINTIISTQDMREFLKFAPGPYPYSSNISNNYSILLQDAFSNIKDVLNDDIKQKMLTHTLTEQDKHFIQSEVCKFIKKYYDSAYNLIIKKGYVKRIVNSATIIDLCGLLPKNNTVNNYRLSYLGIDFLGYDYYENKNDNSIKRPYLASLMDENFIKSFNTDELIALSTFYSNRLAKCSIEYNDILYLLYKTDTIRKYYDNPNYKFDLSNDKISTILAQHEILEKPARFYLEKQVKNKRTKFNENFLYEDINTTEISSTLHKYGTNYESSFEQLLPEYKHDIIQDFVKSIDLQLTVNNAYGMKKHALESLLLMLIDNKEINWGVVMEKVDNIKYDKDPYNNFLIGIDMKGFNMPIKLHCEEAQIREFLTNYTGKAIIPVYKGNDDFIIDNTYYSTQVLYKLSNDQRELLHKKAEEIDSNDKAYKFVKHLEWISNPKEKPEFIDEKKQYYDMNSGKVIDEYNLEK